MPTYVINGLATRMEFLLQKCDSPRVGYEVFQLCITRVPVKTGDIQQLK